MAITFVNAGAQTASNASPQSPALPTNHASGDLLLLFCVQASASGITFGPPNGWNSIARNSNATRSMTIEVFAKYDNGSESAPSTTCSSAAGGWATQIGAWRGVNRATVEDQTEVASDAAAAQTFQPTGITTQTANAWVVSFVCSKDDNALSLSVANGYTARMSGANYDDTAGNGSDYSVGVADQEFASAGAKTCPTWNQTVNNNDAWVALTLALLAAVDQTATPGVKNLTLATFAPTVTATLNQLVTPSTKALTISRFAPTVSTPRLCTPGTKSLTITAFAPTVSTPVACTPTTKALTVTRLAPTVTAPALATPTTKSLALTAFAPTVTASDFKLVTPGTASLAITRYAPTVDIPTGGTMTPGVLMLTLTMYAPTVTGDPPLVAPVPGDPTWFVPRPLRHPNQVGKTRRLQQMFLKP